MKKVNMRRLARLIDATARTASAAFKANTALMDYCRDVYGAEPGDVDADGIIDALGGAGDCNGLSAEEFHQTMTDLTS